MEETLLQAFRVFDVDGTGSCVCVCVCFSRFFAFGYCNRLFRHPHILYPASLILGRINRDELFHSIMVLHEDHPDRKLVNINMQE